ncbi:MAG: hypothetical protein ACUVQ1_08995 [Candidatus Kapaibacteriales bacterium]
MEKEFFTYEQMLERLPDYLFQRLSIEEIEIFERSLPNYPEIAKEIEDVHRIFAKLDKMNIDAYVSKKTKNIPTKLREKIANKQKSLGFLQIPTFRIVVGAIGILIIALSLFWTKNLNLIPLKGLSKSGSVIQTQQFSKNTSDEIQYIDEAEGKKLLDDALEENQIHTIFSASLLDPVLDLDKVEEFNTIADEIIGNYILEGLPLDGRRLYFPEPLTFQQTLEQLENLNEIEFQQLIKELKNVSI